jgi:hypothetical protein
MLPEPVEDRALGLVELARITGAIKRAGSLGLNWLSARTRVAPGPCGRRLKPVLQSVTIRENPVLSCSTAHMILLPSS